MTRERRSFDKEAKEIGFALSEMKKLLESWFNNQLSVEAKVDVLGIKIEEIDGRIRQLKLVRKFLVDGIEDVKEAVLTLPLHIGQSKGQAYVHIVRCALVIT